MNTVQHAGLSQQPVATAFPDSPFVVLKVGGTSVSKADNWRIIADLLRQRTDAGLIPVVVHSALSGVTNALQAIVGQAPTGPVEQQIGAIRQQHEALASARPRARCLRIVFRSPAAAGRWRVRSRQRQSGRAGAHHGHRRAGCHGARRRLAAS